MKYVIVFDYDPDPETESEDFKDGTPIYAFENEVCSIPIKGTLRKLPPRMPQNAYDFETYTNGYAKGNNDVLDKIEGKNGEYDPEVDKI